MELLRDGLQVLRTESKGEGAEQGPVQDRVAEELVLELGPAVAEGDVALDFVHDAQFRWQTGLERVERKDALGEGVERLNGGTVQVRECLRAPCPLAGRQ